MTPDVFVPAISALDTQQYTVPVFLQIHRESVSKRCGWREFEERIGPPKLEQTTLNLHGERKRVSTGDSSMYVTRVSCPRVSVCLYVSL